MKKIICLFTIFFACLIGLSFIKPSSTRSIPPTNVKDILSSSQLSYFARLGTGITINNTQVGVSMTGQPSNSTDNLFVGDTLAIGNSNATLLTTYIVRDIANTTAFQINMGIASSNAFTGAAVIATHSAIHSLYFTPKTNIAGGAWQFLLKASSRSGENQQDGIPDQQGFDLGQDVGSTSTGPGTRLKTADVSCPWGATASVGTTVVISSTSYHDVRCNLAAGITNPVDVGITFTIGRALTTGSQIINPSPNHVLGSGSTVAADVYTFYIRHLDAGSSAVVDADTIQGKIAVIEAVRVTAIVDPTLTFYIDNTDVGTGSTACGNTAFGSNAADTTATQVKFGSLSIGAFNNLAQRLSCVTNATNGYVVTVYEDGLMRTSTGTTIPDTNCDGSCSTTTAAAWTTNTASEWGYTLQGINVGVTAFHYNAGYKAFGNGTSNSQTIMSNTTTPTATETTFICYRITASTTQPTGEYETKLIYTATAQF